MAERNSLRSLRMAIRRHIMDTRLLAGRTLPLDRMVPQRKAIEVVARMEVIAGYLPLDQKEVAWELTPKERQFCFAGF